MREKIKLESSAGTGHFYTTTKNKRTKPDKMEIMKYDPKARKHVMYKETKHKYRKKSPRPAGFFRCPASAGPTNLARRSGATAAKTPPAARCRSPRRDDTSPATA